MWSRILAVAVVVAATLWIGSGVFGRTEDPQSAGTETAAPAAPAFKVGVVTARAESHQRSVVVSGRTEADDRATAMTRTSGSVEELKVRRGDRVAEGDVLAVLSDEARAAQVAQAEALVAQRRTDLQAKLPLIEKGIVAANQRTQLEADLRAAEAALALAQAERDRNEVRAPIAGVVTDVPVTTGQALQPNMEVARLVALDPMLAVGEIAERQLGGVRAGDRATVRLVTGGTVEGTVRFISPTATEGTRTYRVDVEIPNRDGAIPDGVTAEIEFKLAPVIAVRAPRSALTFNAEGQLSVRTVDAANVVQSVPVTIVEDGREEVWLAGPEDGVRLIVQGQDFVKDGQQVEPVETAAPALLSRS